MKKQLDTLILCLKRSIYAYEVEMFKNWTLLFTTKGTKVIFVFKD